jgi:hypothetical protein
MDFSSSPVGEEAGEAEDEDDEDDSANDEDETRESSTEALRLRLLLVAAVRLDAGARGCVAARRGLEAAGVDMTGVTGIFDDEEEGVDGTGCVVAELAARDDLVCRVDCDDEGLLLEREDEGICVDREISRYECVNDI